VERLERLYNNILAGVLVVLMPCALVISISARPFLDSWAGTEFGRESTLPLCILLVGNVLKALSMVPGCLIIAAGRIDLLPKFQAVELIPYGLLLLFLMSRYGIKGAAMAWSIRACAECLFMFHSAGRVSRLRQKVFESKLAIYFLSLMILFTPSLAVYVFHGSLLITWAASLFSICCYFLFVYFRLASSDQRQWIVKSSMSLLG
jgi:O-antigen/teichoic acid export membrane protein